MVDKTDNFLNELDFNNVQSRVLSVWTLPYLCESTGPEITRTKILNIIKELLCDQDEVLLALADVLGGMTEFLGGREYAHLLLPLLEVLVGVEEVTVRKAALKSLIVVYGQLPQTEHTCFVQMIKNLVNSKWYTSRMGACSLFEVSYESVSSELKAALRGLLVDKVPMVRRRAVKKFVGFALKMKKDEYFEMNENFKLTCIDEQDSIRFLNIKNIVRLINFYNVEDIERHLLSIVKSIVNDESWRVRYAFVLEFTDIYEHFKCVTSVDEFVEYFVKFLQDDEENVRRATASKVSEIYLKLELENHFNVIFPHIQCLVNDPSEQVRMTIAGNIADLSPLFGYEFNNQYIVPTYLMLLKDECPQVRLNFVSTVQKLTPYVDFKFFSDYLLSSIVELAKHKQWRVRLDVIGNIPSLSKEFGVQFFNEKLLDLCISWLGDSVFSIRSTAIENLKSLTQIFGTKWTQTQIVPKILSLHNNSFYLCRMTSLLAIASLSQVMPADFINNTMLTPVINLAFDQVPNIRFATAKTLRALIPLLDSAVIQSKIKPILERLINDDDADVRYFGQQAWTLIS